jgi:hypothetical protein
MSIMKTHVLPVAASLYVSRLISGKLSGKIPGMDMIPGQFRGPALAALLMGAGHFATKKVKPLKKYRTGIMTGLGINLLDKVVSAFAPQNVKDMIGISSYDEDIYGRALNDYVAVDAYVGIGDAPPLDDDIALADYIGIGDDYEEDLGDMYADLGMEMDLGDTGMYQDLGQSVGAPGLPADGGFSNRHLGGVHRNQMLSAPIPHRKYTAPVPARSFTKPVPAFGKGFDKPDRLYTGIFNGGWNC